MKSGKIKFKTTHHASEFINFNTRVKNGGWFVFCQGERKTQAYQTGKKCLQVIKRVSVSKKCLQVMGSEVLLVGFIRCLQRQIIGDIRRSNDSI